MREHPRVCFDESIVAREICYDTDFNYMCHLCSGMPNVVQMRSLGKARKPDIQRVPTILLAPPASAKKTPAKHGASSIHSDSATSSQADAAARYISFLVVIYTQTHTKLNNNNHNHNHQRGQSSAAKGGGGGSVKGSAVKEGGDSRGRVAAAVVAGPETVKKKRKRKRCFSRGPKGRPKKSSEDGEEEEEESGEEDAAESSEDEGSSRQRPRARQEKAGGGEEKKPAKQSNAKKRKVAEPSDFEEEEQSADEVPARTSKHKASSRRHEQPGKLANRLVAAADPGPSSSKRLMGGNAKPEDGPGKSFLAEGSRAKDSKGGRAGDNGRAGDKSSAARRDKEHAKLGGKEKVCKEKVYMVPLTSVRRGKKEEGPRQGLIEPGKNPRVCLSLPAPCFYARAPVRFGIAHTVCVSVCLYVSSSYYPYVYIMCVCMCVCV
jgi:hypothetical protein